MRSCAACGASNPENQKFCGECGARLPTDAADHEQRKTVTVLFADVTGSTALGEQLEPESLRRMLSQFFDAAREVIESHGGVVEKFIGDAVMAVFGVPLVHEDDALRALRASLDLMAALQTLNVDLQRQYGATLQIRIGVNTGDVVTGTAERLATGDAVNVAARLEQRAAPGEIYVGQLTAQLAGPAATLEELEAAPLKGKSAPVPMFRLVAASGATRAVRATPMVGRRRQLEMLKGALAQAVADGACVLFTVLGPAGVGKSRLVAEFLNDVGDAAIVVRGRCLSYGNGVGLWPAAEIVHQLQDGAARPDLVELLGQDEAVAAGVRALVDGDVAVSSSAEMAWAVRRVLEQAATVRPLVVVLDDLHWGEPPLFEVAEHLVTLSRDAPILVLAMARPELLERREGWGGGSLNASTVLLEPLDADDTARLVDSLSTSLDEAARAKVRKAAAGNPLFAEEMVALVEAAGGGDVGVPPTIQALLAARLDQLDPAELRALERGAVEGQSFHRSAVEALTPEETDLPRRLLSLVRKDLLRPDRPTLAREDAFRFRHLLVRDAAYDRLPKSTRAALHEQFARWLESRASEIAERDHLVGYHLEQAYLYRLGLGPLDDATRRLGTEAAEHLEAAGRRQMARSDLTGAVDLLDRSASLVPREKPDVALELGVAAGLVLAGRLGEAVARAAATEERAAASGDHIGARQASLLLAMWRLNAGSGGGVQDLERAVNEALPVFEAAGDASALAWAWWAAQNVAHNKCRYGDGLDAAAKKHAFADRSADPFLTGNLGVELAHIALGPISVPEGLELLEQMGERIPGHDPWVDEWRAHLLAYLGRHDEARELHEQVMLAWHERGMMLAAAICGQGEWAIAMAAGDLEAAAAAGRRGCAELERLGERAWMSTNAAQLAESLCRLGRDDEAQHWVERALELGDPDDAMTQAQAQIVRALVAARRGDAAGARGDAEAALRVTAEMQAPQVQGEIAMNAARVFSALGDRGAAEEQLRRAVDLFGAKGSTVYVALATDALAALNAA